MTAEELYDDGGGCAGNGEVNFALPTSHSHNIHQTGQSKIRLLSPVGAKVAEYDLPLAMSVSGSAFRTIA